MTRTARLFKTQLVWDSFYTLQCFLKHSKRLLASSVVISQRSNTSFRLFAEQSHILKLMSARNIFFFSVFCYSGLDSQQKVNHSEKFRLFVVLKHFFLPCTGLYISPYRTIGEPVRRIIENCWRTTKNHQITMRTSSRSSSIRTPVLFSFIFPPFFLFVWPHFFRFEILHPFQTAFVNRFRPFS